MSTSKLIRLEQVLSLIPVSTSTWYNGTKSGIYPKPVKLGPNITAWRMSDIQDLIENGVDLEVNHNI